MSVMSAVWVVARCYQRRTGPKAEKQRNESLVQHHRVCGIPTAVALYSR
jgi:hypothetical protein